MKSNIFWVFSIINFSEGTIFTRMLYNIETVCVLGAVHKWVSLQTTHVLRVYNLLSIHGWCEVKPAENDDGIYE